MEFFAEAEKFCGGWLCWTEEQFLDTSWSYIRKAQEGRDEMMAEFYKFFGGGAPEPETKKPEMTPALFDGLFGGKK